MEWWKIVGILALAIVLFAVIYYFLSESPQKYYRKAKSLHKKGEKAYNSGDHLSAQKYYELAEEYRKRARELE